MLRTRPSCSVFPFLFSAVVACGSGGAETTSPVSSSGATTNQGGAAGAGGEAATGGAGGVGDSTGALGGGASSSAAMGAGGAMPSGGGTGGTPGVINDCTKQTAVPLPPTIGWSYSIADMGCFKAQAPVSVTFQGNFKYHPLMGGSPGKPDSASPFSSHQDGVVTIELPGDYGYYCTLHDSMKGAIFVE